jgi:hypothetical protein
MAAQLLVIALALALLFSPGCSGFNSGAPHVAPAQPNVASMAPQEWYILYSTGMAAHPSPNLAGAWSFPFPSARQPGADVDDHVNYIQTPFHATVLPHSVTLTFRVESASPQYEVIDPADIPPATVHIFFEQQDDNLTSPDGRWWADNSQYNLGSEDNQTITMTIPFDPRQWSNVNGLKDAASFYAALANVGWIGITCGGQYFWGHGVAVGSGSASYILMDFRVE